MRHYKYKDFHTNRIIFETVQPNHVSQEDVDAMVKKKTGRDPRLEKGTILVDIKMVADNG